MNAAHVKIPFDVYKIWGKRGQIKVKAWFDGQLYCGSIAKMEKGADQHLLILTQAIRKQINKQAGETVEVELQIDTSERIITTPAILAEALAAHPAEMAYFQNLSYTHRKEYIHYITEAKKEETKYRRVLKTLEMLTQKRKNPSGN